MSKKLQRIALVTGASKGVGAAIAKQLVADGYIVVIHYFSSTDTTAQTLNVLRKSQPECSMLSADVRVAEEVQQMIDLVVERYGRLDVLVNNVGNFIYKSLAHTSPDAWDDVIDTNLNATFYCCRYALPVMKKQGYGRIVNFGAVSADRMVIRPKTTPYYIAKTGVILLTKQLAGDNAKHGITVNSISPGIVESSVVKLKTPTGKYISFENLAETVGYLVDPAHTYINGANIEVADGFQF